MNNSSEVVENDLQFIVDGLSEELIELRGKEILITGGAGFLGYYFVLTLLHFNRVVKEEFAVRVTILDNFSRGVPDWLTSARADHHIEVIKHDISQPPDLAERRFDYIIHAASIASPTYYRQHPISTMDANVNGLRYLLDYCREMANTEKPVQGLLYFSTSEIYGDPPADMIPTRETYRGNVACIGPRACYDESKRYGETLAWNFAMQHGVPVRIARPFNNYGPGLKITDRRALPDFARDVLAGRNLTLLSSGAPTRTFCYVADAIIGYFKVLVRGRDGEAYNIGVASPEVSMRTLAELVIDISRDLFGYSGNLDFKSSPDPDYLVDNPNRRCPNIDKAKAHLAYSPSVSLEEGVRRTLLWYEENQTGEDL